MKRVFFGLLAVIAICFTTATTTQAQVKVGIFDLDVMVTAMPAYRVVDSLLAIYQRDSLGGEYSYYLGEYQRLDSTLKYIDTPGVKSGKITATKMDLDNKQKQQFLSTLLNWRDIAQQKINYKKAILSQSLYNQVGTSYEKIVKAKGYNIVFKPGTIEYGPRYDNLFIAVAKDLKLTELPQELLAQGVDPDSPAQQPATGGAAKPAGAKPAGKP